MNHRKYGLLLFLASVAILASSILHAAEPKFKIIPVGDSITSILLPSNFSETVTYQVTNQTKITRTLTMVPIQGVTQTTVGTGVCPNPFTLGPQQSCNLVLVITGSQVPASGIKGGPVICKTMGPNDNRPDPFLCSQPNLGNILAVSVTGAGQHAYIANQLGNSVTFCQVNPVTGFLRNCAVTATGLAGVEAVGFNPSKTLFYTSNTLSNSISVCQVSPSTGALSTCVDAGGAGFVSPFAVTFSPDGSIFYTSNLNGLVSACLVDPVTGFLSACVSNASPTFNLPSDMVVNAAGNIAYVTNRGNNTVSVCRVSGQTVNLCDNSSGSLFNAPEGITLSLTGRHAFIANAGSANVVVCEIRDVTGLLANCSVTNGAFRGTGNVGLNNLGTLAYVPNEILNQVFVCNVTLINGQLSSCLPSRGTNFTGPAGVVLN